MLEYSKGSKELTEQYFEKHAELSAYAAELRGLAFAIGDKELLELVNKGYSDTDNSTIREMEVRGQSQKIHTRISQLLENTTRK